MKKNSLYRTALLGLAIASSFLVLSCANQNNVDDGAQMDGAEQTTDQSVADNGTGTDAKKDQSSDLSDLDTAANQGKDASASASADASATPGTGDAATPLPADASATPAPGGSSNEDLDKAMADASGSGQPDAAKQPEASASPTPADASAPPADASATPAAADANKPADAAAATTTASNDKSQTPPAAGDSGAQPPPTDSGATGSGSGSGELAPPPSTAADSGAATAGTSPVADAAAASSAGHKHGHGGAASVPRVRQEPFHRGDATLNRFYFVRRGDTPKSVSELIYGSPERSKALKKWNHGAWKPGKLVYYQSPNQPEDTQMKSFYEERGLTPEQYPVQKGDWISRIAKSKLGAAGSWKEIAVLNGLSSPSAISQGQNLAIYTDLKGGSAPAAQQGSQQQAAGEPPKAEGQAANANSQPPVNPYQQQAQAMQNQIPPGQQPPTGGMGTAAAQGHADQPPAQPIGGGQPPAQAEENPALGQNPQQSPTPPSPESPLAKRRTRNEGVNVGKMLQQNLFFIVMGLGISALLLALLAINKRKRNAEEFNEDGFGATAVKKRR